MWLVGDFETLADNDVYTYVWAWGYYDIENNIFRYGSNIQNFFDKVSYEYTFVEDKTITIYFHNLKFDGSFILGWLNKLGRTEIQDELKDNDKKHYTTLISSLGQYYSIEFWYNKIKFRILNSLNLLNFSVKQLGKTLGFEEQKGEIDYKLHRSENHVLTDEEIEYLKNDVVIVAKALKEIWFDKGFDKMTVGSNALNYCKQQYGSKTYKESYPVLSEKEYDYIKKAYKGGFTFIMGNKDNKEVVNVNGSVFDYNSMYPSIMLLKPLPIGKPNYRVIYNNDISKFRKKLFVINFQCSFKLKENGIPIFLNDNPTIGQTGTYIESSNGLIANLTMTNIDLFHFQKNYHIYDLKMNDLYWFHSRIGDFKKYVEHWGKQKIDCGNKGDVSGKQLAKLMLNSLTGKFATSKLANKKVTKFVNGVLKYEEIQETKQTEYIPLTTFITAWSRNELFTVIYNNKDYFLYSDTDSVHLSCPREQAIIPNQHQSEFGNWKFEYSFTRARYLKRKCYIEEDEIKNIKEVRCGGLSSKYHSLLTFDNFKQGYELEVLRLKQVIGGQVLVESKFKI